MDLRLKVPPTVVFALAALAMAGIAHVIPSWRATFSGQRLIAAVVAAPGVVLIALAGTAFVRARTTVMPMHPDRATVLVTTGAFRVSRNPMYLGLLVLLVAWLAWLGNFGAVVVPPLFVLYLDRFQIAAEEAALARRFGAAYDEYCRRVRRWL